MWKKRGTKKNAKALLLKLEGILKKSIMSAIEKEQNGFRQLKKRKTTEAKTGCFDVRKETLPKSPRAEKKTRI